ncbi:helicase-related protein, partial [Wohlfahrtiimonas larvae]
MMTLQVPNALSDVIGYHFSALIVVGQDKELEFMANVIKPILNQLAEDCKILSLTGFHEIEKTVKDETVKEIVIEVEPESKVEAEPAFGFIVEAESITAEEANISVDKPIDDIKNISEISAESSMEEHHIVLVDRNYKRSYLRNRLKGSEKKTLIITRTRHNAHRLEEYLYQGKVRSRILHANLSDEAKDKVIERFVSGDLSVLLLPEAVAQTVELAGVTDIIFFDLPDVGLEFKERIAVIGERFNVQSTSSIVTLDEIPWVESMEQELKWTLPKIQPAPPQRSHNILRIKNRNNKDKPEKTEKRVGVNRGLRKLGGKNNNQQQKKRNNFTNKQM